MRGARDADLPRGALLLSLGVVRFLPDPTTPNPHPYLAPTPTPAPTPYPYIQVRLLGFLLRSEQGYPARLLKWDECVPAAAAIGAALAAVGAAAVAAAAVHRHGQRRH